MSETRTPYESAPPAESRPLRNVLADLPESPHAELCIAMASFMGYGLYDQGVHCISKARDRFAEYIHSR